MASEQSPNLATASTQLLPTRRRLWLTTVLLVGLLCLCGVVGLWLSSVEGTSFTALPERSIAESKQARDVAEHYLEAFVHENAAAAKAVSTKEHQKSIFANNQNALRWSITSHEVDVASGTASTKGVMVRDKFQRGNGKDTFRSSFTLLQEKKDGRWKVLSFTLGANQ